MRFKKIGFRNSVGVYKSNWVKVILRWNKLGIIKKFGINKNFGFFFNLWGLNCPRTDRFCPIWTESTRLLISYENPKVFWKNLNLRLARFENLIDWHLENTAGDTIVVSSEVFSGIETIVRVSVVPTRVTTIKLKNAWNGLKFCIKGLVERLYTMKPKKSAHAITPTQNGELRDLTKVIVYFAYQ